MPRFQAASAPALPLLAEPRGERADAVRNRSAILAAVERLLRDHAVEDVTMDAVACAAGLGKGTLFRRFGDRASLFHALVDERERQFQEAFIRGPAPLGPEAPPQQRLIAFGQAVLDLTEAHGDVLLAAIGAYPGAWLRSPVHSAYRMHVSALLGAAGVNADAGYLAEVLLGALAVDLVLFQRRVEGHSLQHLKHAWERLVTGVLAGLAD